MRGRRGEFDSDAHAFCSDISLINDPAFLLFLRFRIGQNQNLAVVHFVFQHQQAAVGVDYGRFADFAKFPAMVVLPLRLYPHPVEYAAASSAHRVRDFAHLEIIK